MNNTNHHDTFWILPCHNEKAPLSDILNQLVHHHHMKKNIVLINDGSKHPETLRILKKYEHLITIIHHPKNFGQGASLRTGIQYALQQKASYIITFDTDGQHKISDAMNMIHHMKNHPHIDCLVGSRFLGKANNISWPKKVVLKIGVFLTNLLTGLHLTDVHNGLRIFNTKTAKLLSLKRNDMSHANEIIFNLSFNKIHFAEFPVEIHYTDYSVNKGQKLRNCFKLGYQLFMDYFQYRFFGL